MINVLSNFCRLIKHMLAELREYLRHLTKKGPVNFEMRCKNILIFYVLGFQWFLMDLYHTEVNQSRLLYLLKWLF